MSALEMHDGLFALVKKRILHEVMPGATLARLLQPHIHAQSAVLSDRAGTAMLKQK
ncbi:hypothetical protein QM042_24050 [Escherichia coli]